MQAIQTKYIGPSNVRGSRVKATAQAGSVTLHWDNSKNANENHLMAAKTLATKMGWDYGEWVSGWNAANECVWVCNTDRPFADERFIVGAKQAA